MRDLDSDFDPLIDRILPIARRRWPLIVALPLLGGLLAAVLAGSPTFTTTLQVRAESASAPLEAADLPASLVSVDRSLNAGVAAVRGKAIAAVIGGRVESELDVNISTAVPHAVTITITADSGDAANAAKEEYFRRLSEAYVADAEGQLESVTVVMTARADSLEARLDGVVGQQNDLSSSGAAELAVLVDELVRSETGLEAAEESRRLLPTTLLRVDPGNNLQQSGRVLPFVVGLLLSGLVVGGFLTLAALADPRLHSRRELDAVNEGEFVGVLPAQPDAVADAAVALSIGRIDGPLNVVGIDPSTDTAGFVRRLGDADDALTCLDSADLRSSAVGLENHEEAAATVLLVRWGRSRRDDVIRARRDLSGIADTPVLVVLTGVPRRHLRSASV